MEVNKAAIANRASYTDRNSAAIAARIIVMIVRLVVLVLCIVLRTTRASPRQLVAGLVLKAARWGIRATNCTRTTRCPSAL